MEQRGRLSARFGRVVSSPRFPRRMIFPFTVRSPITIVISSTAAAWGSGNV
jgi:hypothetical protein